MSIKRTKQRSFSGGRESDTDATSPFGNKPVEPVKTWAEQLDGKGDDSFVGYSFSSRFEKGALLSHPKFGKGVVVGVEPQRIEVLFEDGVKKLGHGG
jgi:hypothetical protein